MPDGCSIKRLILSLLSRTYIRLTPLSLEQIIRDRMPNLPRPKIRAAVKELLNQGRLIYSNHFSTTHLELNYNRPVRVSEHVIISPINCSPGPDPDSVIVQIKSGTSFGAGDHPTTRMAIQGLDHVLSLIKNTNGQISPMAALDIGTGSGVLAIAAVLLGVEKAVGTDIDPAACYEARANVDLNGLIKKIRISQETIEKLDENNFSLVLANLRPPTLKQLIHETKAYVTPLSYWVLSGFRIDEQKSLEAMLPSKNTKILWQAQAYEWSAFVMRWEG